jgi:hypothetical protein
MADKQENSFAAARDLLDRRIAASREADKQAREHYLAGQPTADPVEQVRYREFAEQERRAAERERETARIEAENAAGVGRVTRGLWRAQDAIRAAGDRLAAPPPAEWRDVIEQARRDATVKGMDERAAQLQAARQADREAGDREAAG